MFDGRRSTFDEIESRDRLAPSRATLRHALRIDVLRLRVFAGLGFR
jgi:hypothetical protein